MAKKLEIIQTFFKKKSMAKKLEIIQTFFKKKTLAKKLGDYFKYI